MIQIVPFSPQHVYAIDPQSAQAHWIGRASPEYLAHLQAGGIAYTALIDGKVAGCAGLLDTGFDAALLWALASRGCGVHMVALFRCVKRLMTLAPLRRIEATCEAKFKPGCRALEMLGFSLEGLSKRYGSDGQDHFRYGWVNP